MVGVAPASSKAARPIAVSCIPWPNQLHTPLLRVTFSLVVARVAAFIRAVLLDIRMDVRVDDCERHGCHSAGLTLVYPKATGVADHSHAAPDERA